MSEKLNEKTNSILDQRFGHDSLISIATICDNKPYVRTVDTIYVDGSFYVITYALSNKIKQIEKNPLVAVCGEWFTGHGYGENLGYVKKESNLEMFEKLKKAFAAWYDNGHTNDNDPNTVILRIKLTDGLLWEYGTGYDIDFTK